MDKRLHICIVLCPCIAGCIMCLFYGNRAFAMGFTAAILAMLWVWFRDHISKKQVTVGIIGLVSLLFILVVFVKTDSSLGRLLIYKISGRIWLDNWLWGIGLGQFKATYLYYQAAYFAKGNYAAKELLLADNTHFAFNDYFQFVIETGIAGISILVAGAVSFIRLTKAAYRRSVAYNIALNLALVGLTVLGVAAAFTYVFYYYIHFQVLALCCIGVICFYTLKSRLQKVLVVGLLVVIALSAMLAPYHFSFTYYTAIKKMSWIWQSYRAGFRAEAIDSAKRLKPYIEHSREYLDFLSFVYASEGQAEQAIKTTKQLLKIKVTSDLMQRLGHQYYIVGDYRQAERAYQTSINMVPNRFMPRFALFNLYRNTNQKAKAIRCGEIILSLPVKVSSFQVDQVVQAVETELANMLKSPT